MPQSHVVARWLLSLPKQWMKGKFNIRETTKWYIKCWSFCIDTGIVSKKLIDTQPYLILKKKICQYIWMVSCHLSGRTGFTEYFPDGIVENYPGFPPPQDSPSAPSMEVKMEEKKLSNICHSKIWLHSNTPLHHSTPQNAQCPQSGCTRVKGEWWQMWYRNEQEHFLSFFHSSYTS